MSAPTKRVEKFFRLCGAQSLGPQGKSTAYVFPDGAREVVPNDAHHGVANRLIEWARNRYQPDTRTPVGGVKARRAPRIDLERCTASQHAIDRLELMRKQLPDLSFQDITHALILPMRVSWHEDHASWVWHGARVAVAARVDNSGHTTITTLMWSTTELWDAFPRPEGEKR